MLEKIVIIMALVWAVNCLFWENMILSWIAEGLATLTNNIKKPLFDCVICGTPWYGSFFYWVIWGDSWQEWLIVIFSAMGINAILSSFLEKD